MLCPVAVTDFFFWYLLVLLLCYLNIFFKTPTVLNLSFHTRTALFALKDPKAKACCWDCKDFTLGKLSDGSMIGRLNTSSP